MVNLVQKLTLPLRSRMVGSLILAGRAALAVPFYNHALPPRHLLAYLIFIQYFMLSKLFTLTDNRDIANNNKKKNAELAAVRDVFICVDQAPAPPAARSTNCQNLACLS